MFELATTIKETLDSIKDIKDCIPSFLEKESHHLSGNDAINITEPVSEQKTGGITPYQREILREEYGLEDRDIDHLASWEEFEQKRFGEPEASGLEDKTDQVAEQKKADAEESEPESTDNDSAEEGSEETQGLEGNAEAGEKDSEGNEEAVKNNDTATEEVKELPEKMEPPIVIKFKCPDGVDRAEFERQLKAQENGINDQSVAENMENRKAYQERKEASETGNGRAQEANEAQKSAREKAYQSRIAANMKQGMSYAKAKNEADEWIKTQAALHNPDQIAGGDPSDVSEMGDANVNSSIGSQWKSRVKELESATNEFAKDYSEEELSAIKMNVKLEVE